MLTQSVFRALAHFFNEPWKANEINTLWFSVPFITSWSRLNRITAVCFNQISVVAFLTQVFYCYRIAILSKSKYAVVSIIAVRHCVTRTYIIFLLTFGIETFSAFCLAARCWYSDNNTNKKHGVYLQFTANQDIFDHDWCMIPFIHTLCLVILLY